MASRRINGEHMFTLDQLNGSVIEIGKDKGVPKKLGKIF